MNATVLWYSSRAVGVVCLVLFTAVVVLGIATAGRASSTAFPRAAVLRLHRALSIAATAFIAVHIATAILDSYVNISYWDIVVPFGSSFDPFWIGLGAVAIDLLIAIGITSAFRRRLSLRAWRAVHLSQIRGLGALWDGVVNVRMPSDVGKWSCRRLPLATPEGHRFDVICCCVVSGCVSPSWVPSGADRAG